MRSSANSIRHGPASAYGVGVHYGETNMARTTPLEKATFVSKVTRLSAAIPAFSPLKPRGDEYHSIRNGYDLKVTAGPVLTFPDFQSVYMHTYIGTICWKSELKLKVVVRSFRLLGHPVGIE
jgi:hypothetical protein